MNYVRITGQSPEQRKLSLRSRMFERAHCSYSILPQRIENVRHLLCPSRISIYVHDKDLSKNVLCIQTSTEPMTSIRRPRHCRVNIMMHLLRNAHRRRRCPLKDEFPPHTLHP